MKIYRKISNKMNLEIELTDNEMEYIYDMKRKYKKIEKELDICFECGTIEKMDYEVLKGNYNFYDAVIEAYQKMNNHNRLLIPQIMMLNNAIHTVIGNYYDKNN